MLRELYLWGVTLYKRDIPTRLRSITLRRIWNLFLLRTSFHLSRLVKRPIHWGMPFSISVEPTTACNLGCPECPSGLKQFTRPTGKMDIDLFHRILDEVGSTLSYITFYFQGEPYLHPRFTEMVQEAHRRGIYSTTSTNGHFLSDEKAEMTVRSGLSKLIVSIDGTTQEVYERYRVHGDLEQVKAGVRRVISARSRLGSRTPLVVLQFLVVGPNEHQVEDVRALARELGVDGVELKSAQIYDFAGGSELIPKETRWSRYREVSPGRWEVKNKLLNECWRMWQGCVFTWDGRVVPCCFDKDGEYVMGEMGGSGFRGVWRGDGYRGFRGQVLRGRDGIEMCRNCTEGMERE